MALGVGGGHMNEWKILIVEDDMDMHDVTKLTLKRFEYSGRKLSFLQATTAKEAKQIMKEHSDIAVILLDVVMESDHAGLDFARFVRKDLKNKIVQIILRTGQPGQAPEEHVIFEYDINDYQEKSELTSQKLKTSIVTALRSYEALSTVSHQNEKLKYLYEELEESQNEIFYTLGEIAESRTADMGNHVKRVGEIAAVIADKYGLDSNEIKHLKLAATMHDLGKLVIPEAILNKPGKLTIEEFEVMKSHASLGSDMLSSSNKEILQIASIIAKEHHENYDGTGYPRGLKEDEITLLSRIVSIADVYDALGNTRVYKRPWSQEKILGYMEEENGKKFDPKLMEIFFKYIDELQKIRHKYPD